MNLNGKNMIIKSRAVSDIRNPLVVTVAAVNSYCINAGLGTEFIDDIDVGSGKTEKASAPIPSGLYFTTYLVRDIDCN